MPEWKHTVPMSGGQPKQMSLVMLLTGEVLVYTPDPAVASMTCPASTPVITHFAHSYTCQSGPVFQAPPPLESGFSFPKIGVGIVAPNNNNDDNNSKGMHPRTLHTSPKITPPHSYPDMFNRLCQETLERRIRPWTPHGVRELRTEFSGTLGRIANFSRGGMEVEREEQSMFSEQRRTTKPAMRPQSAQPND
jgi:hypothetical protein